MIRRFQSKALEQLFVKGTSRRMKASLQARAVMILDILDHAEVLSDLNLPGLNFHSLRGFRPKRFQFISMAPGVSRLSFRMEKLIESTWSNITETLHQL